MQYIWYLGRYSQKENYNILITKTICSRTFEYRHKEIKNIYNIVIIKSLWTTIYFFVPLIILNLKTICRRFSYFFIRRTNLMISLFSIFILGLWHRLKISWTHRTVRILRMKIMERTYFPRNIWHRQISSYLNIYVRLSMRQK